MIHYSIQNAKISTYLRFHVAAIQTLAQFTSFHVEYA